MPSDHTAPAAGSELPAAGVLGRRLAENTGCCADAERHGGAGEHQWRREADVPQPAALRAAGGRAEHAARVEGALLRTGLLLLGACAPTRSPLRRKQEAKLELSTDALCADGNLRPQLHVLDWLAQ